MAKGLDKKKETKKQPAKTLKEKRAAKNEKKSTRGWVAGAWRTSASGRTCGLHLGLHLINAIGMAQGLH